MTPTDPRILLARALTSRDGVEALNPQEAAVAALGAADLRAQLEERAKLSAPAPAPESQVERLLTVAEVAERFQVTPRWVRERARKWPFAVRLTRRVLRIPERQLEAWMRKNRL